MQPRLQVLAVLSSLFLFLLILELIRTGKLRARYALVWLTSALVIFILSVFKGSLNFFAELVQIAYAPSLLFIVGLGLVIIIQLYQTLSISKLTLNNRNLAQKIAILEHLQVRIPNTNRISDSLEPELAPKGHDKQTALNSHEGN